MEEILKFWVKSSFVSNFVSIFGSIVGQILSKIKVIKILGRPHDYDTLLWLCEIALIMPVGIMLSTPRVQ